MSLSKRMTVQQAAKFLNVGASTVRRFAGEGRLAGSKDPVGRWQFFLADLEAFKAACSANHMESLGLNEQDQAAAPARRREIGFASSLGYGRTESGGMVAVGRGSEPDQSGWACDWGVVAPSALCMVVCLAFLVLRQFDFYFSKGFSWWLALFCAVIGELFILYLSYVSESFSFKKFTSWLLIGLVGYLGFILCFNVVQEAFRGSMKADQVRVQVGIVESNLAMAQAEYDKALTDRDMDLERVQAARSERDRVYLRKLMNRPFGSETKLKAAGEALRASQASVSTAPLPVDPGISGWLLAVFSVLVLLVNIVAVRNLVSGIV